VKLRFTGNPQKKRPNFSSRHLRAGRPPVTAYRFIQQNRERYAVREMAGLLGVSCNALVPMGQVRGVPGRSEADAAGLVDLIRRIQERHHYRYGSPRVRLKRPAEEEVHPNHRFPAYPAGLPKHVEIWTVKKEVVLLFHQGTEYHHTPAGGDLKNPGTARHPAHATATQKASPASAGLAFWARRRSKAIGFSAIPHHTALFTTRV
jgi:hypothetical protein